jgi:hypothetical protein
VRFGSDAGAHRVDFFFQKISNEVSRGVPERGNVSSSTMHQVVRRLFAGHVPELTVKELTEKGILITAAEVTGEFTLARILNDNFLEMKFKT